MNKRLMILTIMTLMMGSLFLGGSALAETEYVTMYYGDVSLDGNWHWTPGTWDLTCDEVIVRYTLDLSGAPNIAFTGEWGQAGYVGLVNPADSSGAWMSGFLYDGDNSGTEFPTYPDIDDNLDMDDKFNMQRMPYPGSWSESMYDVYCETSVVADVPFGSGNNYGIWFDRDGVDLWQPNMWGMVDGGTYNTLGEYQVEIVYNPSSNDPTAKGTACPKFFPDLLNPLNQSITSDDIYGVPTGFYSAGWTPTGPDIFPAGISFDTDATKMASMQVFVSGNPGNGEIVVRNLTVTGCLNLEKGTGTGGGWFIPEIDNAVGISEGGKATFGFVAKQDEKKGSTGQLEFQYHADGLNLKSISYDWVAVATTQVMFKGIGLLNGGLGYTFRVRAFDGDKIGTGVDRFEIRIWTIGGDFENPTYRAEGDLGGGQIIIHKK